MALVSPRPDSAPNERPSWSPCGERLRQCFDVYRRYAFDDQLARGGSGVEVQQPPRVVYPDIHRTPEGMLRGHGVVGDAADHEGHGAPTGEEVLRNAVGAGSMGARQHQLERPVYHVEKG